MAPDTRSTSTRGAFSNSNPSHDASAMHSQARGLAPLPEGDRYTKSRKALKPTTSEYGGVVSENRPLATRRPANRLIDIVGAPRIRTPRNTTVQTRAPHEGVPVIRDARYQARFVSARDNLASQREPIRPDISLIPLPPASVGARASFWGNDALGAVLSASHVSPPSSQAHKAKGKAKVKATSTANTSSKYRHHPTQPFSNPSGRVVVDSSYPPPRNEAAHSRKPLPPLPSQARRSSPQNVRNAKSNQQTYRSFTRHGDRRAGVATRPIEPNESPDRSTNYALVNQAPTPTSSNGIYDTQSSTLVDDDGNSSDDSYTGPWLSNAAAREITRRKTAGRYPGLDPEHLTSLSRRSDDSSGSEPSPEELRLAEEHERNMKELEKERKKKNTKKRIGSTMNSVKSSMKSKTCAFASAISSAFSKNISKPNPRAGKYDVFRNF